MTLEELIIGVTTLLVGLRRELNNHQRDETGHINVDSHDEKGRQLQDKINSLVQIRASLEILD